MDSALQAAIAHATKGNRSLRQVLDHLFERAGPASDGDADRKIKALDAKIRRRDEKIKEMGGEIEALKVAVEELKAAGGNKE